MAKITYGLDHLLEDWGYDSVDELVENSLFDSVSPGICPECGYTTEVEPDNNQGWCEPCGKATVVSGCILAGVI